MDFDDAKSLALAEGSGEQGLCVDLRMGRIPTPQRMARLLRALEVIYQPLCGSQTIDRRLAGALYGLAFHVQGEIDQMLAGGHVIPEAFIEHDMVKMFLLVESVLTDEWMLD